MSVKVPTPSSEPAATSPWQLNRARASRYLSTARVGLLTCLLASAALGQTISEFPLPTAGAGPFNIVAGPDGALWFSELRANKIGRVTTAGGITNEFPANSLPAGITVGPDGALWFTEFVGARIGRITTTGVVTEFPVPSAGSLEEIAVGPDGALWFTDAGNRIGRITTAGVLTQFEVPTPVAIPTGIVAGPDGALWFAESSGNKIGRITTTGAITEFPLPSASSSPQGITAGPDGALWFAEGSGNRIGRITTSGVISEFLLPSPNSYPSSIAAGPDGALWFTETDGNKIGRITTAGVITEFEVPTAGGRPSGIVSAPDGNVWFTETNGNKIGRLTTGLTGPGCTGEATIRCITPLTPRLRQPVPRPFFPQATAIQLSTLSTMAAKPWTALTVSGTGLTQATSAVSVRFIPESGSPAITVPVSAPSSTTLQVMVPPLLDPASGSSISGVVAVQVIQVSGPTLLTSNLIRGLQIAALLPVPTSTPVGSRTTALLNTTLDVFNNTQSSLSGDPVSSPIAAASPNYTADISALISAAGAITANPNTSVSFSAANGSTVTLDARALALSDQMAQALVAELASQTQTPADPGGLAASRTSSTAVPYAPVVDSCPLYPNDPIAYDSNLCWVQRFFQNLTPGENPAVEAQVNKALGVFLPGGLLIPDLIAQQIVGGVTPTLSYSRLTTGAPPPGGDVVEDLVEEVMDRWKDAGPRIGFAVEAFKVFYLAATTFPSRRGAAPVAMIVSDYAGNTYVVRRDGTTAVTVPAAQGSFPIDSLTLVVPPPPPPPTGSVTLTVTVAGTGDGTVVISPLGPAYPVGTVVTLTASPASGSIFTGWSGACVGSALCSVTMNADKAVAATFTAQSFPFEGLITGEWSGNCDVAQGIIPTGGTFFALISPNGTVSGRYTGDDSGTISGSVTATGVFAATAGYAGTSRYSWSGQVSRSGSSLLGSGVWVWAPYCSGNWSGSGTASP